MIDFKGKIRIKEAVQIFNLLLSCYLVKQNLRQDARNTKKTQSFLFFFKKSFLTVL